jgi:hypothetical protein
MKSAMAWVPIRNKCVCLAGAVALAFNAVAQTNDPTSLAEKADFLHNLAQFTEWPTNTFPSSNSPVVIGVLGVDPFGPLLDQAVQGKVLHDRTLTVERYRQVEEIKTCHILFISQSETRRLDSVLESMKGKPVLTVSDIDNAAFRGVMVRFVTETNRIRFRINLGAVQEAGLTLSSQLLRASEIVQTEKKP